jgi:hypothetical protein
MFELGELCLEPGRQRHTHSEPARVRPNIQAAFKRAQEILRQQNEHPTRGLWMDGSRQEQNWRQERHSYQLAVGSYQC